MRWLVAISLMWISDLGYFGPVDVIPLDVEETSVRVGTLRLALESSDSPDRGVGTLNLELEDSVIRVGTLRLELESSPPPAAPGVAGSLGLELE